MIWGGRVGEDGGWRDGQRESLCLVGLGKRPQSGAKRALPFDLMDLVIRKDGEDQWIACVSARKG